MRFGVARDGGSSALVVVNNSDGSRANNHFAETEFLFADDPDGVWTQRAAVSVQGDAVRVTIGATLDTIPYAITTDQSA